MNLSPRESEVCERLSWGMSNKEIAQELRLQLSTIRTHVSSALRKTGSRNRVQLAVKISNADKEIQ